MLIEGKQEGGTLRDMYYVIIATVCQRDGHEFTRASRVSAPFARGLVDGWATPN
jgi:hypothetical protein